MPDVKSCTVKTKSPRFFCRRYLLVCTLPKPIAYNNQIK